MATSNFPATITLALCKHLTDSMKCVICLDEKLSLKQREQKYGAIWIGGGNVIGDKHPGIDFATINDDQRHGHNGANGGNVNITTISSEPSYLEIEGLPSSLPASYYAKPKMFFSSLSPSAYPVETKVCSHCSQPVQSVMYDYHQSK